MPSGSFLSELIAAYRASLDASATSGTAIDQSGNGHNGTLGWWETRISDGGSLAYDFEPTQAAYISIGSVAAMQFQMDAAFTVSLWYRQVTTIGYDCHFAGYSSTADQGWYFYRDASGYVHFYISRGASGWRGKRTNSVVSSGSGAPWVHLVGSRDGTSGETRLWLNGVEQTSVQQGGSVGAVDYTGRAFWLGKKDTGAAGFRGRLDDALIFGRQLNLEEIAALNSGGRGAAYSASGGPYPYVVLARQLLRNGTSPSTTLTLQEDDIVILWGQGNYTVSGTTVNSVDVSPITQGKLYTYTVPSTGSYTFTIGGTSNTSTVLLMVVRGGGSVSVRTKQSGTATYDSGSGQYVYSLGSPGSIADSSLALALLGSTYTSSAADTSASLGWGSTAWTRLTAEQQQYDEGTSEYITQRVWADRRTSDSRSPGAMQAESTGDYAQTVDTIFLVIEPPASTPDPVEYDVVLDAESGLTFELLVLQPFETDVVLNSEASLGFQVEVFQPLEVDVELAAGAGLSFGLDVIQPGDLDVELAAEASLGFRAKFIRDYVAEFDADADLGFNPQFGFSDELELRTEASLGFQIEVLRPANLFRLRQIIADKSAMLSGGDVVTVPDELLDVVLRRLG